MTEEYDRNTGWDFNRALDYLKSTAHTVEEQQWLDTLFATGVLYEKLWTLGHALFTPEFCRICENMLPEYVSLETTDKDAGAVYPQLKAHLDTCTHCAAEYSALIQWLEPAYTGQIPRAASHPAFDLSFLSAPDVPARSFEQAVWQTLSTAGATFHHLATHITLALREPFAQLAEALQSTTVLIPVPVRDKEKVETIQMLNLECPSANLTIRVGRGPVQAQRTAVLIDVLQMDPHEPVPDARVALYDQQHQLLERRGTDLAGNVCFTDMEVGAYVVQVQHAGETWEMAITLVP